VFSELCQSARKESSVMKKAKENLSFDFEEFLKAALEGEMNSHMAVCLEESENQNRRNGKSSKTIQSPMGAFELETPRNREGSFEPQIVKKRQTVLKPFLDNKILGLYGLGMGYQDGVVCDNNGKRLSNSNVYRGSCVKIARSSMCCQKKRQRVFR
jgi:transposase-like protein